MKRIIFLSVTIFCLAIVKSAAQIDDAIISGNLTVGSILQSGTSKAPGSGNTVEYKWFYSDNTPLETASSHKITTLEEGKIFYIIATEYDSGHNIVGVPFTSSNTTPVNYMPVSTTPIITGTPASGQVLVATYTYSDTENDQESGSIFQWYRSSTTHVHDTVLVPGANSLFYLLTSDDYGKYFAFKVIPRSSTGSTDGWPVMFSFTTPISNYTPVATAVIISGPGTFNVNDVLIGDYHYSDQEGDQEGGSVFEWIRSDDNTYSAGDAVLPVSTRYYKLTPADTGKFIFFRITPVAVKGDPDGTPVLSSASGRVNTPPYVKNVGISGSVVIGQTITGIYSYGDRDGDLQDSASTIYRWYLNDTLITGATGRNYTLGEDDEGKTLKFNVTPVSLTGNPGIGNTVTYLYPGTLPVSSTSLSVSQLCISGTNSKGSIVTAEYDFTGTSSSKKFRYKWLRDNTEITGATSISYKIDSLDINHVIRIEVVPVSKSGLRQGSPVKSDTLAMIHLVQPLFYKSDPDTILKASPAGGYFFGDGVFTADGVSRFSPGSLDINLSPFTIYYSSSSFTCQQTAPKTIRVEPVSMFLLGVNPRYCTNERNDTIYARKIIPGATNFRFLMTGPDAIVYQADTMAIISPKLMRPGSSDNLTFICDLTLNFIYFSITFPIPVSQTLIVYKAPEVSLGKLEDNQVMCSNLKSFNLKPEPAGGIYSDTTIKADILNPAKLIGSKTLKYTYKEISTGCIDSATYHYTVNPAPVVDFEPVDVCIENQNDSTEFRNKTVPNDAIRSWEWRFHESGVVLSKSDSITWFLYKTGGSHKVELIATTTHNCADTLLKDIDLGNKPVADFFWLNECLHEKGTDSLHLYDKSTSISSVDSTIWVFPDGTRRKYKGRFTGATEYIKPDSGYFNVKLVVKTNYLNCHDDTTRRVYIRPVITIPTDGYVENLENGKAGWVPYNEKNKIWSFGKPTQGEISHAASGVKAWYTSYPQASQKKDSASIISPCFDFTGVKRPMIKMMLWKRFDRDRDGAALQYKIGDQPGWTYVGSYDDGINWYNSVLIKGKPGDGTLGWTAGSGNTKDADYVESSNKLDTLTGKKDVKFRISYGSDGSSINNDGIAFDDIWIGSRTRGVLLEHFTNNSSSASTIPTNTVTSLANRWTDDVINIQYHTNFPGTDPYYDANPADAGARFLFYGLTKAPYTFIDGGTDNTNFATLFDYNLLLFNEAKIYKRSLVNPLFSINMTATVTPGKVLHVSGTIKALKAINAENLTLYIAVTQKKNTLNSKQYFNIFRKFIPDAGGIPMPGSMTPDQVFSLTERTWVYSGFENSDMEVIVFIQNNITKVVYQAESDIRPDNVVGIDDVDPGHKIDFSIWPNPSSGKLTVEFDKPLNSETGIMIYDFSGTLVRTYKTSTGDSEFVIDDHGLKNGIYLVRVSSGGIDRGYRKLVVSQNR